MTTTENTAAITLTADEITTLRFALDRMAAKDARLAEMMGAPELAARLADAFKAAVA